MGFLYSQWVIRIFALFVATLAKSELRQFVRNSLPGAVFPEDRQVVLTNQGEAYRLNGLWFKWHGTVGSKVAIKDQASITTWAHVEGLPRA